ncbi:hypothetical protein OROGR_002348 [Orobanche gracilis]
MRELEQFVGSEISLPSVCTRIHCPVEANPAWRWSYYQPWRDQSIEPSDVEKLDEIHASEKLLIVASNILLEKSGCSHFFPLKDINNLHVHEWEKSAIQSDSFGRRNAAADWPAKKAVAGRVTDLCNKPISQLIKPELAEIKSDLKEQLTPLKDMQDQLSVLLKQREPSLAPQSTRMPFGLADLMNRVEEQLARFVDGKNGEGKGEEKSDSDDRACETRSKQNSEQLLLQAGTSSSKRKAVSEEPEERLTAPKRRRTRQPVVELYWEDKEMYEVEGCLPRDCVEIWGVAKQEFIKKYYLEEILQENENTPQEIFINFMEHNYPDLWEKIKVFAEKNFKAFPMIPDFRPEEALTLLDGQVDEEALKKEINQLIIKENLRTAEEQKCAANIIKRKYGLLPVKKKPIGGKRKWVPPPGRSYRLAKGRRIQ